VLVVVEGEVGFGEAGFEATRVFFGGRWRDRNQSRDWICEEDGGGGAEKIRSALRVEALRLLEISWVLLREG